MAHPLIWPGKYFFYPIGNTSAVCLTRDLPFEEPANILLLGCGDPRNVLYTIFCEPPNMNRQLDFTCCDMDPGVLSRNLLLLTMIADKQHNPTDIWNIFFHIYLNKKSNALLIEHCEKLVKLSDSLQHWNASPYGGFAKMCTEYTLSELRRHWSLYIHMQELPPQRMKDIRRDFTTVFQSPLSKSNVLLSPARSSGPLMVKAVKVSTDLGKHYWKTGITSTDTQQRASATILNPTFAYCLAGEGCFVHYGTDPLTPFHLAALFGNAKRPVSVSDAVNAAKAEFNDWCSAFYTSISSPSTKPPIIRFFLGEATAVCKALHSFATTGTLMLGVPVAQWNTQLIRLNEDDYVSQAAPAIFNVIDTSNLDDHIGLLNVLITAVPLLSTLTPSSVLYTESLLFKSQDATKEFTQRLYTNITIIGLLLGICPIDYLSGFTSRSNTHELILHQVTKGEATQFHQVTTWKTSISGDAARHDAFTPQGALPPTFDPRQLGTLLYDMYHQLYEHEDAKNFLKMHQENLLKAISQSNMVHYIRETFVLFLKIVRHKLRISDEDWLQVIDRFFDLVSEDKSMPMDTLNYQELCAQLHRNGVYTVPIYIFEKLPKIGRFSDWDTVPPLVRIILVVPRDKLVVLEESSDKIGTPPLQCDVGGSWSQNLFTSVHTAFGRVVPMGTKARPWVVFEEDPKKWGGSSPLVVSFVMPARLLTSIEPMEKLNVSLSVKTTPGTIMLISKLGMALRVFGAKLMDRSAVHVLPDQPLPSQTIQSTPATSTIHSSEFGKPSPIAIELDEQCELVTTFTGRVSIDNKAVQSLFQSGATPQATQISPTILKLTLGNHSQNVLFPFPIIGSQHKLRLARKSLYIEAVVPVFSPFGSDGMKISPFPLINTGGHLNPWNIHRLNLSRLPVLDMKATKLGEWLNPHVGSILSSRERSAWKKHETDTLMFVKQTIHAIFVRSSGIQGGPAQRLFALRDKTTKDCDTLFFVSDLRFDLQCHTVVCDAYVLSLTDPLLAKIKNPFSNLVLQGNAHQVSIFEGEMQAWKTLLPVLVERGRTWKHKEKCEYVSQGKVPLSDAVSEDPLCSCGKGQDVEGMTKVDLWRELAPYVTRFVLSPLFAVSYLETVGRDPAKYMCFVCRKRGKPKLMTCTACQKVRYCSRECQKKDWKSHKIRCNAK